MKRIPLGLVLGFGLALASEMAFNLVLYWTSHHEDLGTWHQSRTGAGLDLAIFVVRLVAQVLTVGGAVELARRTRSGPAFWFSIAVAFALAIMVVQGIFVRFVINAYELTPARFHWWLDQMYRATALAWLAAAIALVVGAARTPTGRALAAPMLISTLLAHPFPSLYAWLAKHYYGGMLGSVRGLAADATLSIACGALILACADQLAVSSPVDPIPRRAAAWAWSRAGDAMLAAVAVLVVAIGFVAFGIDHAPRTSGMALLLLDAGFVAIAGFLLAMVLAAAVPDGAPRWRLHVAAALLGFAFAVHAFRLGSAGTILRGHHDNLDAVLHVLTIVPLLATSAALWPLASACAPRAIAVQAGGTAVVFGLVAISLQEWAFDHARVSVLALAALVQLGAMAWPAMLARAHGRALAAEGAPAPLPRAQVRT